MNKQTVYRISYFLMALRVFISFFAWFDFMLLTIIVVSLLDSIDGLVPYLAFKGKVEEFKQKLDYSADMLSRIIFLVPAFMFLPSVLIPWFVLFFAWYYITTIMRVVTGNPLFVAFTCPISILIIGVGILQYFSLPFVWLGIFLEIGMIYEYLWHYSWYIH